MLVRCNYTLGLYQCNDSLHCKANLAYIELTLHVHCTYTVHAFQFDLVCINIWHFVPNGSVKLSHVSSHECKISGAEKHKIDVY